MQFHQISNNAVFPEKCDFYYKLFAFGACILNPFDRKIISTGIIVKGLTNSNKYFRIEGIRELFDQFGILVHNDVIEEDCEITLSVFNTAFPTEFFNTGKPSVLTGLFGMKNKYIIKSGELIGRMFVFEKN